MDPKDNNGADIPDDKRDPKMKWKSTPGEGAYLLFPEIEKDGYNYKYNFANLDPNIIY